MAVVHNLQYLAGKPLVDLNRQEYIVLTSSGYSSSSPEQQQCILSVPFKSLMPPKQDRWSSIMNQHKSITKSKAELPASIQGYLDEYNMLREKGVKLKNAPQTEDEKRLKKVYSRLHYNKSKLIAQ